MANEMRFLIGFDSRGASQAKQAAENVAKSLEDITKKLRGADFTPMNELERALRRAEFGAKSVAGEIGKIGPVARNMSGLFGPNIARSFDATSASAGNLGKSIGLTNQQALALTYTFNDVVASLASGTSVMTIALQQGGQLTQAFGGLRGTFTGLLPILVRFAPAIAALAAIGGAIKLASLGVDAGKTATELQKSADAAGLTTSQFQKLSQAANTMGLDSEGVVSGVTTVGKAAQAVADDLDGGLVGALFKAGSGVVGMSRSVEDGVAKFRLYGKELKGSEGLAAALGVSLKDGAGNAKDASSLTFDYARALTGIRDPALQARAAIALLGEKGAIEWLPTIREGVQAVDEFQRKTKVETPLFSEADILAGREQQRVLGELGRTWDDYGAKIQIALMPAGNSVLKGLNEALQSNRGNIEGFVKWIESSAIPLFNDFIRVLSGQAPQTDTLKNIVADVRDLIQLAKDARGYLEGFLRPIQEASAATGLTDLTGKLEILAKVLRRVATDAGTLKDIAGIFGLAPQVAPQQQYAPQAGAAPLPQSEFQRQIQSLQRLRDQQSAPQVERRSDAAPGSQLAAVGESAQQSAQGLATLGSATDQAAASLASISQTAQGDIGLATLATSIADLQSRVAEIAAAFGQAASSAQQFAQSVGGGGTVNAATGGFISGPGTGTSDSILARLSNGEYVIRSAAVRHFGPGVFHALNNLRTPKFALGGLVGAALRMPSFDLPSFATGGLMDAAVAAAPGSGGSGRSFSLVLDGQTFGGLTGPSDTLDALEKRATQRTLSRTMRRKPSWA